MRALKDYEMKQQQTGISALLCAKTEETAAAVKHLKEEYSELKYQIAEKDKLLASYRADMVPDEEETVCIFPGYRSRGDASAHEPVLEKDRKLCAVFYGTTWKATAM